MSGVPVLATESGGIVDVVTDQVTGLLVPERDPEALAGAAERLLTDRPQLVGGKPDHQPTTRCDQVDIVGALLEHEVEELQRFERITALPRLVIEQDGEACELNQAGLHSNRFEQGVLVPQEYELWDFHEWLRRRLGETER